MTTPFTPHLRHGYHHQMKQRNSENHSPFLFPHDFHQNFGSTSVPLNFSVTELKEIKIQATNATEEFIDLILSIPTLPVNQTFNENMSFPNSTDIIDVKLLYALVIPPMFFFCALTILVNVVIVTSARWCRKPMSPTLYFSISLALADAYASLILGLGLLVNSYLPVVYEIIINDNCLKLIIEGFRLGGILVSVSHLLALAINHWIGIIRPLHYAATMTRRTAWIIILASWICPILVIFIYFTSRDGSGFLSERCDGWRFLEFSKFRIVFSFFFFIPLGIMSLIYIHIFFIVRNHQNHRRRYQQSCQQLSRNVKAVVTTVLILGTYILGWMPALLMSVLVCNDCAFTGREIPEHTRYALTIIVNSLIILKAFVNPIIYAARMADVKVALRTMRYDLFSKCFGTCVPPSPVPNPIERCSSRYERSTKSLRMSSFGSCSSTRRALATNLNSNNSPPVTSRRHVNSGAYVRGNSRIGNGGQTKLEMTEMNHKP